MNKQELNAALLKQTEGMLYISESDYELDVQDRGKQDRESLLKEIAKERSIDVTEVEQLEADAFFDKTINALDPSDEFAAGLAEQYKALYAFLKGSFNPVFVFRAGKIQMHIYIACFTAVGDCFVLHTISVET